MKKTQGAVFDRRVGAISSVSVTVYNQGTTNKPTIYSDNGITPQANPFQTDSLGRWAFYVANGRYDIEFSGPTIQTFLLGDVLITDLADDLTQYAKLTGRSGGQTLHGGTGPGENLYLKSTSHATKGRVFIQCDSLSNIGLGSESLIANTTGLNNTALGLNSLHDNLTGQANTAIGVSALHGNISGNGNTAVGLDSLYSNPTGTNQVAVGVKALFFNTGYGNVALGFQAGYYETGSNKLFIDNQPRANEVDARAKALIHGTFATDPPNQILRFNAHVGIGVSPGAPFEIAKESTYLTMRARVHSDTVWHAPFWEIQRARGTFASPAAVAVDDAIGYFDFIGYDGSDWVRSCQLATYVASAVSTNKIPGRFEISLMDGDGNYGARLRLAGTGSLGIGIYPTPVISDGVGFHIKGGKILRLDTSKTPASATATGNVGEICWDASYVYVCIATNSWKRAAIEAW